MSKSWSKVKWGDQDGDDGEMEEKEAAPQVSTFITPIDKDGIKTITELSVDEQGRTVKTVRKVKEIKQIQKVNKNILQRRKWAKFGECADLPPGPESGATYPSHEVFTLNLKPKKREDQKDEEDEDPLMKLNQKDSIVVCRMCGETGHWTLKCPQRGAIVPKGQTAETAKDITKTEEGGSGKYVPVHMRKGGAGAGDRATQERDDSATVRVTNISLDTTEDDLRELFRRFGHTSRIYLAKDRQNGQSRGFAFINYTTTEAAQKAIDKLDGHGYANLILRVEFAKPRDESARPESLGAGGKQGAGWTMQGTR